MKHDDQKKSKTDAFQYLKSLTPYMHKGERTQEIGPITAKSFTDTFRAITDPFTIPISWNVDKAALINLLGITSYEGYEAISRCDYSNYRKWDG